MSHATKVFYPLFIASGITGIRDASSPHPLAKLRRWRQEILAGTRVGPPRQLLSGPAIDDKQSGCSGSPFYVPYHICVSGPAEARRVVDSLKAAGADIIKTYNLRRDAYFAIAAEARRVGLPVGGHNNGVTSAFEASDSGVSILDHPHMAGDSVGGVASLCLGYRATLARCRPLAERFQRNGTWWVPTLLMAYVQNPEPSVGNWGWAFTVRGRKWLHASKNIAKRATAFGTAFVNDTTSAKDSAPVFDLQPDSVGVARTPGTLQPAAPAADGALEIAHSAGLPILAGTDEEWEQRFHLPIGFSLHAELAMYVAEGLTALEALQTATLNPAKMLHGTDSLGTVAPGKLADLVLLDANPLADITNTTKIRAVVANGRYFDRAALDQLVIGARAAMRGP